MGVCVCVCAGWGGSHTRLLLGLRISREGLGGPERGSGEAAAQSPWREACCQALQASGQSGWSLLTS